MENKAYEHSYLGQVVALLDVCFPEKKISERSFIWKHCDKFFNGKIFSMLAFDGGKLCSFVCFVPIAIARNRDSVPNFYSCAVQTTHPEYRRQGIVSRLTQLIEKNIGLGAEYIGFSNESGVKIDKFSKKINYKILGQMATQYVFSLPYRTNLIIKRTDKVLLYDSEFTDYFSIVKSHGYLNWRYERNPKNKHEYSEVMKDGCSIGYVVYKEGKIKNEVFDLVLKSGSAKLCGDVIRSFARYSLSRGKVFVSFSFLPNKFWNSCFPKASLRNKIRIYFTIKTANADLLDIENWIVQGGDIQ